MKRLLATLFNIIKNKYQVIKKQIKLRTHKKINLVFVCHRPNVWGSLKTVYESALCDEMFNVTIVAIPNKKQIPQKGLDHEFYETEGAEEYFKDYHCKVINGYNYETKKWFNLKKLEPDYIFFQQPYNVCKPKQYKSKHVSKYAKICYVHYASNFIGNGVFEDTYPHDFIKNVSLFFSESEYDKNLINEQLRNINNNAKLFVTGFPRYDNLEQYTNIESKNWNFEKSGSIKRIIWTPRWCTNENNCNFFEYKDKLLDYVKNNGDIDFIFRPHPQAFSEWERTGEFPHNEAEKYKKEYEKLNNSKIDIQKEYLTTFYTSDIMITDISSIIAEYFLTGNPIIYCHKTDCFNDFSRKVSKGFYWVRNWQELEQTLNMLKSGNDPLKEERQQIIKDNFYFAPNGAGNKIIELIKKDFYGKD